MGKLCHKSCGKCNSIARHGNSHMPRHAFTTCSVVLIYSQCHAGSPNHQRHLVLIQLSAQSFMSAQNVFSYCVGGLALISTVSSAIFYCGLYLPSTQLRLLDELLIETKNIYHKTTDEKLLTVEASSYAQTRLRRLAVIP